MLAGKISLKVGTRVKIVKSDDRCLIGATGELTHPFAGLFWSGARAVAGFRIDQDGIFSHNQCNLLEDDIFKVLFDEGE